MGEGGGEGSRYCRGRGGRSWAELDGGLEGEVTVLTRMTMRTVEVDGLCEDIEEEEGN